MKIINQYDAHFMKSDMACVRQRRGKDNGVTKYHKVMLNTEKYKNVCNGHGHCVS